MPLQRTEGPVYIPHAKRDPSQQGPDVRIHSALQQGASQNPVSQNAINPSKKDTRKEPRKDPGKDAIKKPQHADAKLAGARKKKPGVEGTSFLNTFDFLKWFRATTKHVRFLSA